MTVARLFLLSSLVAVLGCQPSPPTASHDPAVQGALIDSPAGSTPSGETVSPSSSSGLRVAPTDPYERAKLAVDAPKPKARDGYRSVSFAELSDFVYQADMNGKLSPESHLPETIQELDKTTVAVSGYLMPIEFQKDKVSTLILVRNQLLCCFGEEPKLNEWVFVNVDPPVEAVTDVPVTMYGTFYASPDLEEGQVISLYRMQANTMETMP